MTVSAAEITAAIDGRAKPVGSLGRLETLAADIAAIRGTLRPSLGRAMLVVFAGDHGLVAEGVTAYPVAVSGAIARLVLEGRAGASVAAKAGAADLTLVDAGLLAPLDAHPMLIERRFGAGTENSRHGPAMSLATARAAVAAGRAIADRLAADGCDILALGEIGIGNSSAASLVGHALTGVPLATLVGPGAGVRPTDIGDGLDHKRSVLADAYARAPVTEPMLALAEFAGFEMAMMTGAMLAARDHAQVVIVDGFIATACAVVATAIDPASRCSMVFAHTSAEPGHRALLGHLDARPLFDLGLRLGEGTGAALAIPFVRAAAGILTDMASLADVLASA